jgi:hypothetical protein
MGSSEKIDRLPRYRTVLVTTALLATRDAPPARETRPRVGAKGWTGLELDHSGWRAVAVAAGAVAASTLVLG